MPDLRYLSVHEALLTRFPELAAPCQRLFDDWDNYGGEPPGQYIVFSDTYGTLLEIALSLPSETTGRNELLSRACDFGEQMLRSRSDAVRSLAIDALAETLDGHPDGPSAAARYGGPELKAWFAGYSSSALERPSCDEIIDLWGVRASIAPMLPETPLTEIPGISHPQAHSALGSLPEARAQHDGAVLLAGFGTTRLYLASRAIEVECDEATLEQAARDLADAVGGEDPSGGPSARYCRIPYGERVWNMDRGSARHTRLDDAMWIADRFESLRGSLVDLLAGRQERITAIGSDSSPS